MHPFASRRMDKLKREKTNPKGAKCKTLSTFKGS